MEDVLGYYRTVAPFYDLELRARGDEELWASLGRAHADRTVLEVGAGSGRATALLAAGGARVVGLDLSPEMLGLAAARRLDAALVRGDMRALPCRPGGFETVVAADDPFSHLTEDADRAQTLAEIAAALAPGGLFVLDALWLPPAERARLDGAGRVVDRQVELGGGWLAVHEHWRHAPAAPHCLATYDYRLDGRPAARATFHTRYWTEPELAHAFDAAGLAVARRWGGYHGEPWRPESPCLVIEARKA
jgi:SAM-dependent methyltransferase